MFLIQFKYTKIIPAQPDPNPNSYNYGSSTGEITQYVYGLFPTVFDAHQAFKTSHPEIEYWETEIFINFSKPIPAFLTSALSKPLLSISPQGQANGQDNETKAETDNRTTEQ